MHGPPHHIAHELSLAVVTQLGATSCAFTRDVVPGWFVVEIDVAKKRPALFLLGYSAALGNTVLVNLACLLLAEFLIVSPDTGSEGMHIKSCIGERAHDRACR